MTQDHNYPSALKDRFIVRLPDGMRDRIKAAADANNRSMNAEIIDRLEFSFVADEQTAEKNVRRRALLERVKKHNVSGVEDLIARLEETMTLQRSLLDDVAPVLADMLGRSRALEDERQRLELERSEKLETEEPDALESPRSPSKRKVSVGKGSGRRAIKLTGGD